VGLFWGLLAAFSYAAMSLLLRATAVQVDPLVGALVRTVPMVLGAWALLLAERRSHPAAHQPDPSAPTSPSGWPGWPAFWPLVVVGVLMIVVGNGSFQAALAIGGLTVTMPAMSGASIWGGALGGWWLVGERLSGRSAAGLFLLVASLPLLTASGGGGTGPAWLGALAGATAGLTYGIANVVIRRTAVLYRLPQGVTLAPVVTSGLIGLCVVVLLVQGPAALTGLDDLTLASLLGAGVLNATAFFALTRALALLPVSRVGSLAALQTGLAAIGGVLLFAEPLTTTVGLGLLLSVSGVILAQQRMPAVPPPAVPPDGTPTASALLDERRPAGSPSRS
jgi:drug/metabolite transporter (DMT)-like permease